MQKNGKKQRDRHDAATRWLIFFGVAIVLSVMLWLGWSLTNRRNPIPVFGTLTTDSTVSIGLRDAPESLDIRTQQGHAVEQALLGNVYETLVSRSETNKLQPELASSWRISDDGLTYTFTLRSGVKFSNGHSLDSADAVWSLQNAVNNHYVDADQLDGLQQVDNPDAHTLIITLSKPNPRLLRALSGRAGIVYDEESDNDYAKTAIGSGPFTVARASKSEIVLQRNDSYWGTKAASSQITLYYYSSESSLTSAMEGGKISMALPLSADAAETLNATRGISADSGISFDKVMLAFNNANESILVDQQMRKVMRYAIDARSIAKAANDSYGALGGPISPLEDGYEDLTELFPHDLTQAQQLRSYFGTGYIGTIDLLIPQQYETIGNTVKEQIEQLGVSVNMEVLDTATVQQRVNDGSYTIALITMSGENDASVFTDGQSVFHFENGDCQRAYADALAATNDDDYQERMRTYARTVSENAACDWLYTRKNFMAVSDRLQGYPKNLTDRLLPLSRVALH